MLWQPRKGGLNRADRERGQALEAPATPEVKTRRNEVKPSAAPRPQLAPFKRLPDLGMVAQLVNGEEQRKADAAKKAAELAVIAANRLISDGGCKVKAGREGGYVARGKGVVAFGATPAEARETWKRFHLVTP